MCINSGKTYNQTGSDVLTPGLLAGGMSAGCPPLCGDLGAKGDINITAQQVNILAAQNTSQNVQETKFKQTGLTLAITSPIISAIQTAQQMSEASKETDDSRLKALAAGTTALSAMNAKDAIVAGNTPKLDENRLEVLDANGQNTAENPANQVGGINISLSLGTSKSSSKTTQTSTSAQSSTLNAGGDINITAAGAGKDSDINIMGSQVKAADDVTLKADDEINLLAAQNVDTLNSKNSGSSASIGVSFGTDGFLVTASASGNKGKAKGNGTTWTETTIQGGNQDGDTVKLESGTDTNVIGAQIIGNQVVANVGTSGAGNLNIQSLQDTDQYKDKQQSVGGSISVGYGKMGGSFNYSDSKTKSNYNSVNEQSGIMAGVGGFQANVAGNTNLTGAVMASTIEAIQDNKNSLTTQTLTISNIENLAEYEANAMSMSVGGGTQSGKPTLSGAGVGSDSGYASSVAISGISSGTVSITDNAKQQTITGQDATTTVAMLNRDVKVNENGEVVDSSGNSTANNIASIFDPEIIAKEIQAQVQITQAFSQEAPRALNSFAQSQIKSYLDANKTLDDAKAQLELTTDPAEQEQLQTAIIQAEQTIIETQADYEKWKEGGDYRVASNIIIAAISGGTSGVVGAVTQESLSWAADVMRQAMIEDSEKFAGVIGADGKVWSNSTGESVGVEGDNEKVAGGRIVLDDLCANGRCIEDKTTITGYAEDEYGRVRLTISIDSLKELPEYKDWRSPLGGHQGEQGQMAVPGIQFDYVAGSFWDKLAEAYSGTHDTLNSFIWYDELGNGKKLDGSLLGKIGDITNLTNVALATPFAMSVLLPPEVWNAVFSAIKAK